MIRTRALVMSAVALAAFTSAWASAGLQDPARPVPPSKPGGPAGEVPQLKGHPDGTKRPPNLIPPPNPPFQEPFGHPRGQGFSGFMAPQDGLGQDRGFFDPRNPQGFQPPMSPMPWGLGEAPTPISQIYQDAEDLYVVRGQEIFRISKKDMTIRGHVLLPPPPRGPQGFGQPNDRPPLPQPGRMGSGRIAPGAPSVQSLHVRSGKSGK